MRAHFYRMAVVGVLVAAGGCKGKSGESGSASPATPDPAVVSPLAFLSGFEGQIDLAFTSKNRSGAPETVPISLQIKSDKIRAEMPQSLGSKPMPKGHVVLSAPEKKLSIIMDEQKQIVVVDLNQIGDRLKSMGEGMPPAAKEARDHQPSKPPPKVTKTGVTDKVAGLTCENWDVSEESRKVASLCIADRGASWFHFPLTGIPTEYAWALELMDGKHLPLRAIGYDKAGAEDGRVEITKLEKKSVSPALFEMPEGYKVMDMGAMMAQLGGLTAAAGPDQLGARPRGAMPFGATPGWPPPAKKPK